MFVKTKREIKMVIVSSKMASKLCCFGSVFGITSCVLVHSIGRDCTSTNEFMVKFTLVLQKCFNILVEQSNNFASWSLSSIEMFNEECTQVLLNFSNSEDEEPMFSTIVDLAFSVSFFMYFINRSTIVFI